MRNIILVTFCFISPFIYSQTNFRNYYPNTKGDTIIINKSYTICYDIKMKSPLWSIHLLTKEHINNEICERGDSEFECAKNIKTAENKDYVKSGYDRGHIVPAKDMEFSEEAMNSCFLYYNCSPQLPRLNRVEWRQIENYTRTYTKECDSLLVISGVYFDKLNDNYIGDKVFIPSHYYKIFYDFRKNKESAVAFLVRNIDEKQEIENCIISIDSLEIITGIDFFQKLNDKIENRIEENKDESHFVKLKN